MLAHAGDDEDDDKEDEGGNKVRPARTKYKYLDPLISARPVTSIRRVASWYNCF
jgi:hypothetical protein